LPSIPLVYFIELFYSSLIRAGATLATGVLTILGPLIESLGDTIDTTVFYMIDRFYNDSYRLPTASRPLGPLLTSLASYNATQAQAVALCSKSKNTFSAPATATATATAATSLALAGLCMAVGTKLAGDALSSGPTGILQSINTIRRMEQTSTSEGGSTTTVSGFSFGGGGGWASAAAAAAAAAAQNNGDSKETELTAILRSVLPSLEFNGFTETLPMVGDEKVVAAAATTVGDVLLKETGRLGLSAEIELNAGPEQFLEDMVVKPVEVAAGSASDASIEKKEGPKEGPKENQLGQDEVRKTLGRGLILIGDPGRVLGLRTPRGFSLDGVGIPVGVDDGRRYL
jgi:hypothetical protein